MFLDAVAVVARELVSRARRIAAFLVRSIGAVTIEVADPREGNALARPTFASELILGAVLGRASGGIFIRAVNGAIHLSVALPFLRDARPVAALEFRGRARRFTRTNVDFLVAAVTAIVFAIAGPGRWHAPSVTALDLMR